MVLELFFYCVTVQAKNNIINFVDSHNFVYMQCFVIFNWNKGGVCVEICLCGRVMCDVIETEGL